MARCGARRDGASPAVRTTPANGGRRADASVSAIAGSRSSTSPPPGHQPISDAAGESDHRLQRRDLQLRRASRRARGQGRTFRSDSDTEVILAAYREWGADCCRGSTACSPSRSTMRARQALLLARDRAARSRFSITTRTGLRFASELKALLADPSLPRRVDPESLDCYLADGYVPGRAMHSARLPQAAAGACAALRPANGHMRSMALLALAGAPACREQERRTNSRCSTSSSPLLSDSVRRQLIADVPVGVLLSGGVDSSLVTAMAARAHRRSSRRSRSAFPAMAAYDETEHARLIAREFGTEHVELEAAAARPICCRGWRAVRRADARLVDDSDFLVASWCVALHRRIGRRRGRRAVRRLWQLQPASWMEERLGRVPQPLRS